LLIAENIQRSDHNLKEIDTNALDPDPGFGIFSDLYRKGLSDNTEEK
jgi:hypothetical protein